MSTLFTLTVTDQAQATKAVEVQTIARACLLAAQQCRSLKTSGSGNVVNDGGVVIATWTYTGSGGNN